MNVGNWLKILLGLALGILVIWVGLSGRPGALVAAFVTPDSLQSSGG